MPYLSIASIAYCEQVGLNLQEGGNKGDIKRLYTLIVHITIPLVIALALHSSFRRFHRRFAAVEPIQRTAELAL